MKYSFLRHGIAVFAATVLLLFRASGGLVVNYEFNNALIDSTGHNPAAAVFGASFGPDRFGNPNAALSFDGVDDFARGSVAGLPLGNSERTITAWVKPEAFGALPALIHWGFGNCFPVPGQMFGIGLDLDYINQDGERIHGPGAFVWGGCLDFQSQIQAPLAEWSFVAASYDGSSVRIRVNDQEVVGLLSAGDPLHTANNGFLIMGATASDGSNPGGPGPGFDSYFSGSLDDIRVYDEALSAEDLENIYSTTAIPEPAILTWIAALALGLSALVRLAMKGSKV